MDLSTDTVRSHQAKYLSWASDRDSTLPLDFSKKQSRGDIKHAYEILINSNVADHYPTNDFVTYKMQQYDKNNFDTKIDERQLLDEWSEFRVEKLPSAQKALFFRLKRTDIELPLVYLDFSRMIDTEGKKREQGIFLVKARRIVHQRQRRQT